MPSPEWRKEKGIGEARLVRMAGDEIIEARIQLHNVVRVGGILEANLASVGVNRRNGLAIEKGQQYFLPRVPEGVTEGLRVWIEVTREAIPGVEPWKRPIARIVNQSHRPEPKSDYERIPFPSPRDELEEAGWSDLLEEAHSGIVCFEGGELRVSPTPAMTLFDVDGWLPPAQLAIAGAEAAARAILRHGVGGSIGIDLPTVEGKVERTAVGGRIDSVLPKPFERTAMNGFGFVQIVRPRRRASLFELAQDRGPFEARALLRRAARETGAIRLVARPAVIKVLEAHPDWLEALGRQIGGGVGLRSDPSLSISGGHAEKA